MTHTLRRLYLSILILLLVAGSALADVASPDTDAAGWARALYDAFTSGRWKIVAGLSMLGVVYAIRFVASKWIPWFKTKTGGFLLGFAVALLTTLGAAFAADAPVSLGLLLSALGTAATAAGLWGWIKDKLPALGKPVSDSTSVPVGK